MTTDFKTQIVAFSATDIMDLAQQIHDRQAMEGWEIVCHSIAYVGGAVMPRYRALVTYRTE